MTFLFVGLDGADKEWIDRFDVLDFSDNDDVPVNIQRLEQNLPDVLSEKGQEEALYGHWTFYVWGAIASGQLRTPEMRQEHPTVSETEYPLTLRYLRENPGNLWTWLQNRLRNKPRYKQFIWDWFDNVRIINYPLHMPEYNRNAALMRDDAISRDYNRHELDLLAAEINDAIRKNYDAVFVVTRIIDCISHGATAPGNYNAEDMDDMMQGLIDRDFEEWHEDGMPADEFIEQGEVQVSDQQTQDKEDLVDAVLDHVKDTYQQAEQFLEAINWDGVDHHVVVSDHGFDKLGAGSVKAHSREAILSCSFGQWRKMSEFVLNWTDALKEAMSNVDSEDREEFGEQTQEEKVKNRLEDLGYI